MGGRTNGCSTAHEGGETLGTDWVARATAIGSAAIALTSLGWNIFAWRRQGPVIRLRATCTGRGDQMKISGRIFNQGRFDAQVESGSFQWRSSAQAPAGGVVPMGSRTL